MNSRAKAGLFLAFCTSVGVHGVAYASLAKAPRESLPFDFASEVSIEVKPLPAPVALPEPAPPAPDPAPTQGPIATAKIAPPAAVATAAPVPSAPGPIAAAALDLSGVTLTNDTGPGFAMPVGDGSALHGPIGLGKRAAEPARVAPGSAPVAIGPALVAASDLSVHPVPPSLAGLLRTNYPEEARQRGLRGAASVRARIDADGLVRTGRVVSETSAGFGAACRRTVVGSRWSAPRDKNGSAVATEIVYTCHFEVDQ
ncbi:MAG: TonB family protein [Myxococcales bacterium]